MKARLMFFPESGGSHQGGAAEFVIFFSYRWINKDPWELSPDDTKNTQYQRMVRAAEEFLRLHPYVDRERLSIRVVSQKQRKTTALHQYLTLTLSKDYSCINQDDPMPGVSALPI